VFAKLTMRRTVLGHFLNLLYQPREVSMQSTQPLEGCPASFTTLSSHPFCVMKAELPGALRHSPTHRWEVQACSAKAEGRRL
jgi:hypothetical protein